MVKFVRDGKKVWPTCPECGCRLKEESNRLAHFGFPATLIEGRDARGHLCKYADKDFAKIDGEWHFIITTATLNWQKL